MPGVDELRCLLYGVEFAMAGVVVRLVLFFFR